MERTFYKSKKLTFATGDLSCSIFSSLFFSNFNFFILKKISQLKKKKKSCIYTFATLPEIVLWYPEIHENLLNTFAITSYNEIKHSKVNLAFT